MEARGKKIEDWFSVIRQGQITLPRFQRFEAWRPAQVSGLLENILRKPALPIGALLVLEIGDNEPFISRPITGAPEPTGRPQFHLLDGQQRMTALWRSLTGDYDDFAVFVSLKSEDEPTVELVKRHERKGVRQPVWADNPEQILERKLIPAEILNPTEAGAQAMRQWIKAATGGDAEAMLDLQTTVSDFRGRIAGYTIPFLALPVGTDPPVALDVFVNMNTSATPLKDYDIVVAQLEQVAGQSMHALVEALREEVPAVHQFGHIEDYVLAVSALVQGMPPLKRSFLARQFAEGFMDSWDKTRSGIERGLRFLQSEGILYDRFVPTEVAVYLACALWANVPEDGYDDEGRARSLIRKSVWRACYTNRYLKTATTRAYADYRPLAEMIADKTSMATPELFDEEHNPLPDLAELKAAGWPSKKDRLPRAILATTLNAGAIDFADGAAATPESARTREYHHVFPVQFLDENRADQESKVNRALNCALITWRTNRKIAAKNPAEYIQARADAMSLGEETVRHSLKTHLIPYEELVAADFDAFIEKRAERVSSAMRKLCDGLPINAETSKAAPEGASG